MMLFPDGKHPFGFFRPSKNIKNTWTVHPQNVQSVPTWFNLMLTQTPINLEKDTMTSYKVPLRYELNAVENPALLKREGQFQAAEILLADLKKWDPLPEKVCVSIKVPEEHWLERVETGIEKMNRVVNPIGFFDRLKEKAIRKAAGIQGVLHPVQYQRDEDRSMHRIDIVMNLSELSQSDLDGVSHFLKQHESWKKKGDNKSASA